MVIGHLKMQQLHILHCTFDFTTAQIVINCTLKYALLYSIGLLSPHCTYNKMHRDLMHVRLAYFVLILE